MRKTDIMFLQEMLATPYISLADSKNLLASIIAQLSDSVEEAVDVEATISRINREIRQQYLLLVMGRCEVTGGKSVSLISLQRDENHGGWKFSKEGTSYWMNVMHEIVISSSKSLERMECFNIAKRNEPALTLERAEEFLATCTQEGYLVEQTGRYFLGARALDEFVHDLRVNYAGHIKVCELCSEICCYGTTCANCDKLMHTYCANDVISTRNECPLCEERWVCLNSETDNTEEGSTAKRRPRTKRLREAS